MKENREFPAEWANQSAVMVVWPKMDSDWRERYDDATRFFSTVVSALWPVQKVVIVTENVKEARESLFRTDFCPENVLFFECLINDTWVRDFGALTIYENGRPVLLDFQFNGWGMKFAANFDNQMTSKLYASSLLKEGVGYKNLLDFVLEGGSVESDGNGTVMTTTHCLMAPNRNAGKTIDELTGYLKEILGAKQVLSLNHGALEGDDTDGHIDTLARFCPNNVIAYVQCKDKNDSHYEEMRLMEEQLKTFRNIDGMPYDLVALPMPRPIYDGDRRLPATYANFLITNKRVLCPIYGQPDVDLEALQVLMGLFPNHEVKAIDCNVLISQGGSLHCSTMQFPEGVF